MSTQLTPEEIDDILYCARAGEVAELTEVIDAVVARLGAGAAGEDLTSLIAAAKNESENTALHYAAANGHAGEWQHAQRTESQPLTRHEQTYSPTSSRASRCLPCCSPTKPATQRCTGPR